MFILQIDFNSTPNQELDYIIFAVPACQMQWRRQRLVNEVWLGSRPLNQEHEHFSRAHTRSLMYHSLAKLIIQI